MYIDDIKHHFFAKNEKELETLIHTVRIYSQDTGMELGIEKCAMLVNKSGKRNLTEGMGLSKQDKLRTLGEKETYKYLGILKADTIKQVVMKEKIKKEYLRKTRKLLDIKLSRRNLNKRLDTWAVPFVRYSGPFLKGTREELKQMDQRTRKLMTIHKALHPRDDVDRLFISRKREEEHLPALKTALTHRYNDSRKARRRTDNSHQKRYWHHDRQQNNNNWETKMGRKTTLRRFKRLINNISHDKTWTGLRKGNFKRETKSLQIAGQNNAIRTNHIKARINKTQRIANVSYVVINCINDQLHNKRMQQINTERV